MFLNRRGIVRLFGLLSHRPHRHQKWISSPAEGKKLTHRKSPRRLPLQWNNLMSWMISQLQQREKRELRRKRRQKVMRHCPERSHQIRTAMNQEELPMKPKARSKVSLSREVPEIIQTMETEAVTSIFFPMQMN